MALKNDYFFEFSQKLSPDTPEIFSGICFLKPGTSLKNTT